MKIARLVNSEIMWLIVAAGGVICYFVWPHQPVNAVSSYWRWLLLPATVYWLTFFLGAIQVNHHVMKSVVMVDQVVTSGVYGILRHPIYAADIVLAWAVWLARPQEWLLWAVIWLNIVLLGWMLLEERNLIKRFGSAYRDYQCRVPMFIPYRWRPGQRITNA